MTMLYSGGASLPMRGRPSGRASRAAGLNGGPASVPIMCPCPSRAVAAAPADAATALDDAAPRAATLTPAASSPAVRRRRCVAAAAAPPRRVAGCCAAAQHEVMTQETLAAEGRPLKDLPAAVVVQGGF
eukprot:365104-Chlamydomonas_euryale.AAC.6